VPLPPTPLLTFVDVQAALAEVMAKESARCELKVDQIIDGLLQGFSCLGSASV
jgi:hypothetical protein